MGSISGEIDLAQSQGHDSLIIKDINDPYTAGDDALNYEPATHYIVFSPNQIINANTGLTMVETQELGGIMESIKKTDEHRAKLKR